MLLVGLTGGIGAGKSTVAELLGRARRGGRSTPTQSPATSWSPASRRCAALVERFGPGSSSPTARSTVPPSPTIAFATDDDRRGAQRDHPPGDRRRDEPPDRTRRPTTPSSCGRPAARRDRGLRGSRDYDAVIVVEAPIDARLDRLVARGMSRERRASAGMAAEDRRRATARIATHLDRQRRRPGRPGDPGRRGLGRTRAHAPGRRSTARAAGITVTPRRYARAMPPLELVSDLSPAGDQPAAIDALAQGIERGDRFQTLLGITGSGKSFTIAGVIAKVQRPTIVLAPEQEPRRAAHERVPGAVPEEPGRVLRLLLRLLPARGLPPDHRHLHREGLVDQRRDRPASALGHERAHVAARRDHRGVGVGDLRPRRARASTSSSRLILDRGEERDQRAILARLVELQYERNDFTFARNKFRVRGDTIEVFPAYEERAVRIQLFGDEVERIASVDPAHRRGGRGARPPRAVPGVALRHRRRPHAGRDRGHRGRARRAARVVRAARQAARGAAPAHAHHLRPRDDARDRRVLRHRELLALARRPRRRADALHAARLLPRRLPRRRRRVARHRAAAPRPVRGRPLAQGHARRPRVPAAVGDATTGRCGSTSSWRR